MPSISELVIVLVLIIAIGVATGFFGRPGLSRSGPASASKKASVDDKGTKLKKDPESGVYIPESEDKKEA